MSAAVCKAWPAVTFTVAHGEAPLGHVAVRVEDDGHGVPGRGELRRGDVPTVGAKEVALIFGHAVVDLDVVVGTVGMELQLKVVEGEENGGALGHHNQPHAVDVVGVETREVWAGYVARRGSQDPPTFDTLNITGNK